MLFGQSTHNHSSLFIQFDEVIIVFPGSHHSRVPVKTCDEGTIPLHALSYNV